MSNKHKRTTTASSAGKPGRTTSKPAQPAYTNNETIAIHGGYEVDPTTKAAAVPIYQTVAYAFDSAEHGAALFNLEVEGFRYTQIRNPTNAVLERRVAALEGGLEALSVASGQSATNYALINIAELGTNIVSFRSFMARHTRYSLISCPARGSPSDLRNPIIQPRLNN